MITLYRRRESREADEIQAQLEELVLAHKVVQADERQPSEPTPPSDERQPIDVKLPADVALPAIVDGDEVYSGEAITALLDQLEIDITFSRQVSADACYVDPENPERCI